MDDSFSLVINRTSDNIDFNNTGNTLFFFAENDLIFLGYTLIGIDIDTVTSDPIFNVGFTSPDYDDLLSGVTSTLSVNDQLKNVRLEDSIVIPMGSFMYINVTTASVSTSNVQKISFIVSPI